MADAAFHILSKKPAECTVNTFTDEEVLRKEGITNIDDYSMVPGATLQSDLFL
jgi:citronellol/citronellal dehydrogenase